MSIERILIKLATIQFMLLIFSQAVYHQMDFISRKSPIHYYEGTSGIDNPERVISHSSNRDRSTITDTKRNK